MEGTYLPELPQSSWDRPNLVATTEWHCIPWNLRVIFQGLASEVLAALGWAAITARTSPAAESEQEYNTWLEVKLQGCDPNPEIPFWLLLQFRKGIQISCWPLSEERMLFSQWANYAQDVHGSSCHNAQSYLYIHFIFANVKIQCKTPWLPFQMSILNV